MKRILHIAKYYYPFRGGTEQIAQDCANALAEYEQKIFCFHHEAGDRTDQVDGIEVIRCGCFAKVSSQSLSLSYGKKLKEVMEDFKPDIVIFHYPNPFAARYLLKFLAEESKLVIYWHLDIVKQTFLRQLFRTQNLKLLERAAQVIATSPNYMEGSHWLKLASEKCVVVPNCIDEKRMEKTAKSMEIEKRIKKENEGKVICLAVGRHTKYKGFHYLIEASQYLDDRFRFYIAGKGELTEKLKKEAAGDGKVKFLGLVSEDELKAYFSAMDIFCFSSITKNEAFGLALAEGMYYGKPAVTFTIEGSGVNYVNLDGITGIEVENRNVRAYAEAIKTLAEHRTMREAYGKAGRKRVVENFLKEQFVENIRKRIGSL